ncbi:MAG: Hpt domain-containing protein [Polyangiaceae bacterium]
MVSANVLEEYWWEVRGRRRLPRAAVHAARFRTMLARHQPHHIDTSRVRELAAICKPGELRELITDYFNSVAKLRAELDAAAATRDAKRARRAAHDLKANCATFGAVAVARLAAEIEARAVHDVPPTSDTLARLAQLDSVATEELRSLAPD